VDALDDKHQFQLQSGGGEGGVSFHHESWKELLDDEEHGGPLIPIMILAHEHDPDPEMRPYKDNINAELRDKLILGISGAVTAIYRYFAPLRRMMAAGLGAERTAYRQIIALIITPEGLPLTPRISSRGKLLNQN